jgi:prepilin-type N-terminal cleavage/methylation domain-containing protein
MGLKIKGYTLVELLVSLAIFAVVIGSLMSILISQNTFFSRAAASVDVGSSARKVMDLMVKELRTAKGSVVHVYDRPLDQGGVVLDHINGKSIVFQVPVDWDGDGDRFNDWGVIEWGNEGGLEWSTEYYYDAPNRRVMRRLWSDANVAVSETEVADNISDFLIQGFRYNTTTRSYELYSSCDLIEITVTAERDTVAGRTVAAPLTYTLVNRVKWRNN